MIHKDYLVLEVVFYIFRSSNYYNYYFLDILTYFFTIKVMGIITTEYKYYQVSLFF